MDSSYIRDFAKAVRSGIKSQAYMMWISNIQRDFEAITDAKMKSEAMKRITRIGNYAALLIEDPGSRFSIAAEIDSLADLISNH